MSSLKKTLKLLALTSVLCVTPALRADPPPICEPLCITSPCSTNSDCTAAPNGKCNLVCPGAGCCEYR